MRCPYQLKPCFFHEAIVAHRLAIAAKMDRQESTQVGTELRMVSPDLPPDLPWHGAPLLRSLPSRCYPCARSDLLPMCPVRTVAFSLFGQQFASALALAAAA